MNTLLQFARQHSIWTDRLIKIGSGLLVIFFLTGYVLYPLLSTLQMGLSTAWTLLLEQSASWIALRNSLVLSILTVFLSGIVGTGLAYALHFRRLAGHKLLTTLLMFPVAAPALVGTVAFIYLIDKHGLLARLLMDAGLVNNWFAFEGWGAILTVHVYAFYPLVMGFVLTGLRQWNYQLVEAAQLLGAGPGLIFRRLLLPHLTPVLSGAALIVFLSSMTSFSAPFLYGESIPFLTTQIYEAKMNSDLPEAAGFATILIVLCLLIPPLYRLMERKAGVSQTLKGTASAQPTTHQPIDWFSSGICWLIAGLVTLPFLSLLYVSLLPEGVLLRAGLPHQLTLANYQTILTDEEGTKAIVNTLLMTGLTIGLMLVIGGAIAYWITSSRPQVSRVIESIALLPNGVPGTVMALGFILAFNSPSLFTGFLPTLEGTWLLLPLVYVVRSLPVFTQSVVAALRKTNNSLKEPAYLLGASGWYTYRRVIIPLISPAIGYGILLVGIHAAEEFVATIMLYTYDTRTLPITIYALLSNLNNAEAAVYGVLHTVVVLVLLSVFNQWGANCLVEEPSSH